MCQTTVHNSNLTISIVEHEDNTTRLYYPSHQQQCPHPHRQPNPEELGDRECALVARFIAKGCGCVKSCLAQFTTEQIIDSRIDCMELTREELDLVILGELHASMNTSETRGPDSKHKMVQRQRSSVAHTHRGKPVCATVFRFLHTVGKTCTHNNRGEFHH